MTTETNNQHLFIITGFSDDADRVAVPLVLANAALASGDPVLLWLTLEGVELARSGSTDAVGSRSFPEVSSLLDSFIENGGRIGVCPPCAKTHQLDDAQLINGAQWMGGAAVIEAANQGKTLTF